MSIQNSKPYQAGLDIYGKGLDEAVTEYLTILRNEKYHYKIKSGCMVCVDQLKNIFNLIGIKEIINCYLNDCEGLEKIFAKHNMDLKAISFIFNKLISKEELIDNLKNNRFIPDIYDYKAFGYKRVLFKEYQKCMAPLTNIDNFIKRVKFYQKYINQEYSLNYVDEQGTYVEVLCDMYDLVELGYNEEELKDILIKHGFDLKKIPDIEKLNFLDNSSDECNKTEDLIHLASIYNSMTRSEYIKLVDNMFLQLHFYFYNDAPENIDMLYDTIKYPLIGNFLSENSNYSFEDIRIKKISYTHYFDVKIREDYFYVIITDDNNHYILFDKFDDGSLMHADKIGNNKFIVSYKDIKMKICVLNNSVKMYDLNDNNSRFEVIILY
ncbi:MAG: hypothetical protein IJR82_04735 [Bacilli bacterium]|nr:hypothetical protein [Bacilli bacterium]